MKKSGDAMIKQLPISLNGAKKGEVRTQFAALCYRVKKGKVRVLLITSRGSKRWIVPKGWPMEGKTPAASAAREAWEEAGVTGTAIDRCLGVYSYVKPISKSAAPVIVMVYPVHVLQKHADWPDKGQRKRKWRSPQKAAKRLTEPGLRRIVAMFDPATLTP